MGKKYYNGKPNFGRKFNIPTNKKDFMKFCKKRFFYCRNPMIRNIKCGAFVALIGILLIMQIGIPLSLCLILVCIGCLLFVN